MDIGTWLCVMELGVGVLMMAPLTTSTEVHPSLIATRLVPGMTHRFVGDQYGILCMIYGVRK